MWPLVSRPQNIVIRGIIAFLGTEFVVPGAYHFRRRKSDMPNQV